MFFDIGANEGRWSIANLKYADKIIAIDASPTAFNRLKQNVKNYPNIVCLNYAVCNSKEDVTFYNSYCDTVSTLDINWLVSEKSRFGNQWSYSEVKCKPISIDQLIVTYGQPELIKVDVESGEYEAISSLTKKVKNLCFEWASEMNDVTLKCIDYLISLGFTEFAYQLDDNYTTRPDKYTTAHDVVEFLKTTTPKKEWGMIWAR